MYYILKSSDASNGVINLTKKWKGVFKLHSFSFANADNSNDYVLISIKNDKISAVSDQNFGDYSFIITQQETFGDRAHYISKVNDRREQEIELDGTKRLEISFFDASQNSLSLSSWSLVLFQ